MKNFEKPQLMWFFVVIFDAKCDKINMK